eukprot:XP_028343270.1 uncharacterized protein LOC114485670 [Physeter catodon]
MTHICCSSGSQPCARSASRDTFLSDTSNFSLSSASPMPGGFPVGLWLQFSRVNLFCLRGGSSARGAAAGAGFHANQSSSGRAFRPPPQQRLAGCIFQELVVASPLPSDAIFQPDVYCPEYRQRVGHDRRLRSYICTCPEQGSTCQYSSYGASRRLDAANGGADGEQHKREAEWLRRLHRVLEVSYYVRRVTQGDSVFAAYCLRALTMWRPRCKVTSNGSEQPLHGAFDSIGPQRGCAADDAAVALSAATIKGGHPPIFGVHASRRLARIRSRTAGEFVVATRIRSAGATASCGKRGAANNAGARTCKGQSVATAVSGSRTDGECLRQSKLAKAEGLCEGGFCLQTLDLPLVVLSPSRFAGVLRKRVPGAHERRLHRLNVLANAYSTLRSRLRHSIRKGGTAAANGVACAGLCIKSGTPAFRVACIATEGVGKRGGREDIVALPARTAEAAGEWIAAAHGQAEVEYEPSHPGYWQWKATCAAAATIVMCTTLAKISVGAVLVDLALALFTPTAAAALAALAVSMAYTSAAVAGRRGDVTAAAAASTGAAQVAGTSCMERNSSNRRCRIQGLCDTALRSDL